VRCEFLELEKTERRGLCVVKRPSQTRGRTVQEVKRQHRLVEPERAVSRVLDCPERETERDDDPNCRIEDGSTCQKIGSRLPWRGADVFRMRLRRVG
jgi:hypothetical protein